MSDLREYDTSPLGTGKTWFSGNAPGLRHLPMFVRAVAHALMREQGMSKSRAIATAISKMHKWSVSPGATPKTRAKAVRAVAQWEAMKVAAHGRSLKESVVAPDEVRAQLRKGLGLLDHAGDGLRPKTVAEAREIASGQAVSPDKLIRMRAWFARHAVDRRPGWDKDITPGYVAWLLWGGDAGRTWVNRVLSEATYTPEQRRRYATVMRDGGKFPINDRAHAALALKYLHSSDLSMKEKAAVVRRARMFLADPKPASDYMKGTK